MDERSIPPEVLGQDGAHEMIRFWVKDGEHHVSLNIGLFEPEDEAHIWGCMLADIAIHAVRGMQQDRPDIGDEPTVLAQIEAGFYDRLGDRPGASGQLQGVKH